MIIEDAQTAFEIAKLYQPKVKQNLHGVYDLICPINLGEFVPTVKPSAYFSAQNDSNYIYILYCFFHWKDWSSSNFNPLRQLDSHQYDFEGVMLFIDRFDHIQKYIATICHWDIIFKETSSNIVSIEAEGHGIRPGSEDFFNCQLIEDFDELVNIDAPHVKQWLTTTVSPIFNKNGVKMPWQWNDSKLEKKHGRHQTEGLIYKDPSKFLELAKETLLGE